MSDLAEARRVGWKEERRLGKGAGEERGRRGGAQEQSKDSVRGEAPGTNPGEEGRVWEEQGTPRKDGEPQEAPGEVPRTGEQEGWEQSVAAKEPERTGRTQEEGEEGRELKEWAQD